MTAPTFRLVRGRRRLSEDREITLEQHFGRGAAWHVVLRQGKESSVLKFDEERQARVAFDSEWVKDLMATAVTDAWGTQERAMKTLAPENLAMLRKMEQMKRQYENAPKYTRMRRRRRF